MKSVYEMFSNDPLFETEVVIIPIMRNTNVGVKFIWEDYLTPSGTPNTHYDIYSFEEDMPDIVFYNQPYDGVNIPKFQSQNIRKYTDCMVYIPYGLTPIGAMGEPLESNNTGLRRYIFAICIFHKANHFVINIQRELLWMQNP